MDTLTILLHYVLPFILILSSFILGRLLEKRGVKRLRKFTPLARWQGAEIILESLQGIIILWFTLGGFYLATLSIPLRESLKLIIAKILLVTFLASVTLVISRLTVGFIQLYSSKGENGSQLTSLLENLTKLLIFLFGTLIIIQSLGISITPLLTALGIGGVSIDSYSGYLREFNYHSRLILIWPSFAQSNKETAPVVLDGREILTIGSYQLFPAQGRADWISSQLEEAIKLKEPTEISGELGWVTTPSILTGSLVVLLMAILAVAIHWFLGWIWRRFQRQVLKLLRRQNSNPTEPSRLLGLLLRLPLLLARSIVWVATLLYVTNLFPFSRTWSYSITEILIATFTSPIVSFGQNSYSVVNFLILIALFLALIVLANVATEFLRNRVLRTTWLTIGTQEVIAIFSRYALLSIGTIVLLQAWGIQLSSLTILASALGVGIGFGFQNIAKDFGSGFVLLLERAIQVGDFVEVGDYMGTVERIDPRYTLIRTNDRVSIIVPNSRFLDLEVINWSHSNPISRLHLPVGVSYHANINGVRRALLEAAKKHGDVLSQPEPQVWFKGFGDNALDFELLVWIADPVKQPVIKSDLYFLIEATFKQHKIKIPFPQRDLHLRSGTLPLQVSPELEQILSQLSQQLTNGDQ